MVWRVYVSCNSQNKKQLLITTQLSVSPCNGDVICYVRTEINFQSDAFHDSEC